MSCRDFFRLTDEPFRVTPDPGFLYLADQHRQVLAALAGGIARRRGLLCITGEVGVGKTTILRAYIEKVEAKPLAIVHLLSPRVTFPALLRLILGELGQPTDGDLPEMTGRLRDHLAACHRAGRLVALLVDEAQMMPMETLDCLRLLSNLETATDKLLQIVLVGQPELDDLLAMPQLGPLQSRIAVRARLGPLGRSDSLAYIHHRLARVARDDGPVFTRSALNRVVAEAGGVPRKINILCDAALAEAFARRLRPVPRNLVCEIISNSPGRQPRRRRSLAWAAGGLAAVLAGAVLLGTVHAPGRERQAVPPVTAQGPVPTADPPPPQPPPMPTPSPPPFTPPPPAAEPARKIVVKRGDTLSRLSAAIFGSADSRRLLRLQQANPTITDVDRLYPGQIIMVPEREN